MADAKKKPDECIHMLVGRLEDAGKSAIVEINGKGFLRPWLKCEDCGTVFYALEPRKR